VLVHLLSRVLFWTGAGVAASGLGGVFTARLTVPVFVLMVVSGLFLVVLGVLVEVTYALARRMNDMDKALGAAATGLDGRLERHAHVAWRWGRGLALGCVVGMLLANYVGYRRVLSTGRPGDLDVEMSAIAFSLVSVAGVLAAALIGSVFGRTLMFEIDGAIPRAEMEED
jgi:FtsH-binding integral membrane protein